MVVYSFITFRDIITFFANLTIDEGEAFLIQDNGASYRGRYLIENNLLLFNGKSGVINSSKNVTIKNNHIMQMEQTQDKQALESTQAQILSCSIMQSMPL